jgi:hypothetical protein
MKLSIIAAVFIFLCGCATSKSIYLPSGEKGYSISCNGSVLDWSHCFEKAGEICGTRGYQVFDRNGQVGSTFAVTQFGATGGSVIYRTILIKCN